MLFFILILAFSTLKNLPLFLSRFKQLRLLRVMHTGILFLKILIKKSPPINNKSTIQQSWMTRMLGWAPGKQSGHTTIWHKNLQQLDDKAFKMEWHLLFSSSLGLGAKFGRGVTELGTLQLLYFAIFSQSKVQYSAICVQRTYSNVLQACRRTIEV